jgi:hypothetical protein
MRRGGPDRNIFLSYQRRVARGRGVGGWQMGHQQVVRPPMGARLSEWWQRGQCRPAFQRWRKSQDRGGLDLPWPMVRRASRQIFRMEAWRLEIDF